MGLFLFSFVKIAKSQTYTEGECSSKCKDECGKTTNCKQSDGIVINGLCNCNLSTLDIPTYNSLILVIVGSFLLLIVISWSKLSEIFKSIINFKQMSQNRIKHQMRKAYKLNKNLKIVIILIFVGIFFYFYFRHSPTTFLIEDSVDCTWIIGELRTYHTYISDTDCRNQCGLNCQAISKKYVTHQFIKGKSTSIEEGCYPNKCTCTCV